MPPVESSLDPAVILDEWIIKTQNLPEELRFLQDEIADKDRQYDKLVREIEDRDARIQKWIKAHGSHHPNPKEEEYRATIRKNFALAETLSNEKIALTQKLQQIMDKHIRNLDKQLKQLYDRGEPGFTDPDELPSLVRSSAANSASGTPLLRAVNGSNSVTAALNSLSSNGPARAANAQVRNAQLQQHGSASAPATPAASMIMNRQARESSAGPGGGVPKRGPRSATGLGSLPAASSGLARHSSLGPGTPKGHQTATGAQRAGSAGPRATSKASGSGAGRKAGTPSGTAGRKKGTPAAGGGVSKSGLSRVKRAAKNSPSSTADSELSDAVSGSDDDVSDARTGGRNTPAAISRSGSNLTVTGGSGGGGGQSSSSSGGPGGRASSHEPGAGTFDGTHDGPGGGPSSANPNNGPPQHQQQQHQQHRRIDSGASSRGGNNDEVMDVDDDEAGDDRKYCLCQNISFGNMVACDNDECPYEWFHWGCVGLKSEPNGTWYCPECSEKVKKKGRAGS
ncbi:hypothetical protein VTK26DRAFT_5049 [Humicola hyalothermophila]